MSGDVGIKEKIEEVLNQIRPALKDDCVEIELIEIIGNSAKVRFEGFLQSPGLQMTMQSGVERYIKNQVPELEELIVEQQDFDL